MMRAISPAPAHWKFPEPRPDVSTLFEGVSSELGEELVQALVRLPEYDPFLAYGAVKHRHRSMRIVESVRPNWCRLTPFGRALRRQVLLAETQS